MRFVPKSAFGQTVLLIGILLLINQVVSYLSVTYYFIRPSYEQINSLLSTQVKGILASDMLTAESGKLENYTRQTGVKVLSPDQAMQQGLPRAFSLLRVSAPF